MRFCSIQIILYKSICNVRDVKSICNVRDQKFYPSSAMPTSQEIVVVNDDEEAGSNDEFEDDSDDEMELASLDSDLATIQAKIDGLVEQRVSLILANISKE